MNKLLQYHIEVNATPETAFKLWLRQLLSWSGTYSAPELDPRTLYDIGETDCRPMHLKLPKSHSTSFEAMLDRAI